mmetsp:Transcript_182720/g.578860  ORF Transcript_182720/g.578860 Transcript_182720/m.578860 type:complete len:202 (-) Transcript_182720:1547-2152(-)
MGLFQSLHGLGMLLRGVAEQLLDVAQALGDGGVLLVRSLEGIQVLGLLAVGNLDLGVGLAKGLQLLEVFVGVVPKQLLQVVHSLGQGRMVPMGQPQIGQLASMLVVGGLQSLQLLGVLVGRVAHQLLHVLQALLHRRVVVQSALHATRVLVVRLLQCCHILRVLVCGVSNLALQVGDALGDGHVVRLGLDDFSHVLGVLVV